MDVATRLAAQDGVISRAQVLEAGETDSDIKRRIERREWARIHPGVFVDHTGPPTWKQRAWAAVLFYWPAALEGSSALHAAKVRGFEPAPDAPISICVDRTRTVRRRVGITVYQLARAKTQCAMEASPPRQTIEHALLSTAARKKRLDASVAVLADAVQHGRTTAARLRLALELRPKLRHRGVLNEVLCDVDDGVRSVLEQRYLRAVERAHGLPEGQRQEPWVLTGKRGYPDVKYVEQKLVVHLDGKVGHQDSLDRWADWDRDLAGLMESVVSVRVGWAHVLDPCRLASSIGGLLQVRGWVGRLQPCGPVCTAFPTPQVGDGVQTP